MPKLRANHSIELTLEDALKSARWKIECEPDDYAHRIWLETWIIPRLEGALACMRGEIGAGDLVTGR